MGVAVLGTSCARVPAKVATTTPVVQPEETLPDPVPLWIEGAPGAKGNAAPDRPSIAVFRPPAGRSNGTAVVVNPGGGYWVLAVDHEGVQVARWLARNGFTAFVLNYRLRPAYEPEVALLDGQRALRWVRAQATQFAVSPHRIGMMGFSAGGNLASGVGTRFDDGQPDAADPVDRVSSRPDFLVLVYPAISSKVTDKLGQSTDELVTARTPPTFLVHTHEDGLSPEHSVRFYQALLARKIPAELHVFAYGPHGTGIAAGDPELGAWRGLLLGWLRRSGLLTDDPRLAISGRVVIDGQPLRRGWVTLVPQDPTKPVAAVYVDKKDGSFKVDAAHGPCAGVHRVHVHQLAGDENLQQARVSLPDSRAFSSDRPGSAPLELNLVVGMKPVMVDVRTR